MEKFYGQARGETGVPRAVLARKPDCALFDIDVSVDDTPAATALTLLTASVKKLAPALPGYAVLTTRDYDVPSIPGLIKAEASAARLSFRITVPLPATEFEERAARVAAVDDALRVWLLEAKKARPALSVRRQRPVCVLSQGALEAVRVELLAQWHARVEELTKLGRVKVEQVRLMAQVQQVPVGIDAVELSLDLGGVVTLEKDG